MSYGISREEENTTSTLGKIDIYRMKNCIETLNEIMLDDNISKSKLSSKLTKATNLLEGLLRESYRKNELEKASVKLSTKERFEILSKIKILIELDIRSASFIVYCDGRSVYVRIGGVIEVSLSEAFYSYDGYIYNRKIGEMDYYKTENVIDHLYT